MTGTVTVTENVIVGQGVNTDYLKVNAGTSITVSNSVAMDGNTLTGAGYLGSTGGTITNALAVVGAHTNALSLPAAGTAPVASGGASTGADAGTTVKIAVLIGGATYYILASTAPTFT